MAGAVKIGPCGALGGEDGDISNEGEPQRLEALTICSSRIPKGCIHGFSFDYVNQAGQHIKVGPWGKLDPQYNITSIQMGLGEHIVEVSGTTDTDGVTSLKLVTDQKYEYELGCKKGVAFSVPLQHGNGRVVAFFGRSDADALKAVGVYVLDKRGLAPKIGPWGGSSGCYQARHWVQLKSVTVYSTESTSHGRIYGVSCTYVNQTPDEFTFLLTTLGEKKNAFHLEDGDYLNNISGTFDDIVVTSLKLTSRQRPEGYGPFGCARGAAFSVPLEQGNGAVLGFFCRCGDSLVALGVFVGVAPSPEP